MTDEMGIMNIDMGHKWVMTNVYIATFKKKQFLVNLTFGFHERRPNVQAGRRVSSIARYFLIKTKQIKLNL